MRWHVSFLLLSLLLLDCGQQQLVNAKELNLEILLGTVGTFVPAAKPLIDAGISLYKGIKEIKEYFDFEPPKPQSDRQVIDEIQQIVKGIDDHVLELGGKIEESKKDVTQEIAMDLKLFSIEEDILQIDARFDKFIHREKFFIDNETLTNFYLNVISEGKYDSVETILYNINMKVSKEDTSIELLKIIRDKHQSEALMCKRNKSPMHILNDLYNKITVVELKAMILVRYAYSYLYGDSLKSQNLIASYDAQLKRRLDTIISKIKSYMYNAGREFWSCNSGKAYRKLSPIFYNYLTREEDMVIVSADLIKKSSKDSWVKYVGEHENCKYFKNEWAILHCVTDDCKKMKYHHGHGGCKGFLRDCGQIAEGENVEICPSRKNSDREYKQLKMGSTVYGYNTDDCSPYKFTGYKDHWYSLSYKEVCMCTCDRDFDNNQDRFFNLKGVTSDIHQNKVVTGARIIFKDKAFQFEIQQATVTKFGNINGTTVEWKHEPKEHHIRQRYNRTSADRGILDSDHVSDIRYYLNGVGTSLDDIYQIYHSADEHYYRVSYDSLIVNLDVIDAPPNTVLTGLRFSRNIRFSSIDPEALQLEIHYTPINFTSGKLDVENSRWMMPEPKDYTLLDEDDRPEIKFNTRLPKGSYFPPHPRERAYLKFTTSDLKDDIGQNVVPFIDVMPVAPSPTTLLSGAGLIYKSSPNSAGFLAIKLLTYNYEPHLMENN